LRRIEQHPRHGEARFLAADSARIFLSTSSPENWNAPASERSAPSPSRGNPIAAAR
jgi:hypothetical protein